MVPFTVGAGCVFFLFLTFFVVMVFSASDTGDGVGAVGGYVVESLAFVTLFDGGWGSGLLHSVLKKVHVESLVEKAGRLVGVGEVDFDECCWLLGGSAYDSVKSCDVDTL